MDKYYLHRLQKPTGKIDVVLDTDAYNEIDDQFAIAYLLKSEERLKVKALYAAPFHNRRSVSPADGMEKSYHEILNILNLMERQDLQSSVYKGAEGYLPDEKTPVVSPAAQHLARLAMDYTPEKPLYVVAIAAITNVASAILLEPGIIDRIVVVWLGGNALEWPDNKEFNLMQDIAAARIIFGCGVAMVQLPCSGVVTTFSTSGPELEYWLRGRNQLCNYLVDSTIEEARACGAPFCWTRVIWDVTAVAWLLDPAFMDDRLEHSPVPEYDHHYAFDKSRHFIRYVYRIRRDALFADLFTKLSQGKG